jgi:transposase
MDGKRLLKSNDFLWIENQRLREETQSLHQQLSQRDDATRQLADLQLKHQKLIANNAAMRRQITQLRQQLKTQPKAAPPPFIKPATPQSKHPKTPGQKPGHAAALRPAPAHIDVHQQVPLPIDLAGAVSCPHCKTQLSDVKHHQRIVEEIIPVKIQTTCYHTTSGWCPSCRKHLESRADDQPPAADLPHAQLGINALTWAAMMRICYRLPLRQITALFQQLGLKLSPGAIAKQLQRMSRWLHSQYHRLQLALRLAGVVHADETGWRTNGKNGYIWTLTNADHTLYHIDRSRGGKVIANLLGSDFGADGQATLISDFYGAYQQFEGSQQKCLAHLLRELKDSTTRRPELSAHEFFKKSRRLIKEMLKLKTLRPQLNSAEYQHRVQLLEKRLTKLGQNSWDDEDADRLAARLRKYGGQLTTFLHKPEVDGTNNAAERALRPAVVMRKITGGSRSAAGARAWAILASVMRTAQQQGRDVLATIQDLLKAEWSGKPATLLTELLMPTILQESTKSAGR